MKDKTEKFIAIKFSFSRRRSRLSFFDVWRFKTRKRHQMSFKSSHTSHLISLVCTADKRLATYYLLIWQSHRLFHIINFMSKNFSFSNLNSLFFHLEFIFHLIFRFLQTIFFWIEISTFSVLSVAYWIHWIRHNSEADFFFRPTRMKLSRRLKQQWTFFPRLISQSAYCRVGNYRRRLFIFNIVSLSTFPRNVSNCWEESRKIGEFASHFHFASTDSTCLWCQQTDVILAWTNQNWNIFSLLSSFWNVLLFWVW